MLILCIMALFKSYLQDQLVSVKTKMSEEERRIFCSLK